MNKKLAIQGVVPPIVTPLTDGDRVDEPSLRRLVRFLLGARIHGILANGTMGGSLSSLTLAKPLGFHFSTPYPLFKENDHLQGKGLGRRFSLIRFLRAGSQSATTK